MGLLKEKKGVGVIIARMQVPHLTTSHRAVIETVIHRHDRNIIFLGTTNQPIDDSNPFPFEFRADMVLAAFPYVENLTILPLPDCKNDNALWVKTLDNFISAFLNKDEDAVLYGGRDSFIPFYEKDNGKFKCVELSPEDYDSGTDLRKIMSTKLPVYSPETAQAILWTMKQLKS